VVLTHQRGSGHFQRVLFVFGRVDDARYDERHDGEAKSCQKGIQAEFKWTHVSGYFVGVHGCAPNTVAAVVDNIVLIVVVIVVLSSLHCGFIVIFVFDANHS